MIKLDLEPYCQECLQFEPEVEKPVVYYGDQEVYYGGDTIIRCESRYICKRIKNYLEEREKES